MVYADNISEAWKLFNKIFNWNVKVDELSTDRAGYKVYRDEEHFYNYVCDLGDRLEVNIGAETVNIWVKPKNMHEFLNEQDINIIKIALKRFIKDGTQLDTEWDKDYVTTISSAANALNKLI